MIDLTYAIWRCSEDHGFHEVNNTPATWCANLHREVCELAEAMEKPDTPCDKGIDLTAPEEEVADIIIRALDVFTQIWAAWLNPRSEHEVADDVKKSIDGVVERLYMMEGTTADMLLEIHGEISLLWERYRKDGIATDQSSMFAMAILAVLILKTKHFGEVHDMDVERAVRLKHEYNLTRPYRHGGKLA